MPPSLANSAFWRPGIIRKIAACSPYFLSLIHIYAHCAELVRAQDQARYIAGLYAPEDRRAALYALYAFSLEIARVRALVSEPLPGEVRLQWWRDVLEGQAGGETQAHPVAAALLDTIKRYRLPAAPLTALIDARIFDLYDDPMPSLRDLEGYAGETASAVILSLIHI